MLKMDTCDDGHDEIVYLRSDGCPVCILNGQVSVLESKVTDLEATVESKQEQIDELEKEVTRAESRRGD